MLNRPSKTNTPSADWRPIIDPFGSTPVWLSLSKSPIASEHSARNPPWPPSSFLPDARKLHQRQVPYASVSCSPGDPLVNLHPVRHVGA
jgi:hypothetical protein